MTIEKRADMLTQTLPIRPKFRNGNPRKSRIAVASLAMLAGASAASVAGGGGTEAVLKGRAAFGG